MEKTFCDLSQCQKMIDTVVISQNPEFAGAMLIQWGRGHAGKQGSVVITHPTCMLMRKWAHKGGREGREPSFLTECYVFWCEHSGFAPRSEFASHACALRPCSASHTCEQATCTGRLWGHESQKPLSTHWPNGVFPVKATRHTDQFSNKKRRFVCFKEAFFLISCYRPKCV